MGAVGTDRFLFSIVRKRSLVSHVPYVPSRYSHDSPLHLLGYGHCTPISVLVGAPMVLFVVDA